MHGLVVYDQSEADYIVDEYPNITFVPILPEQEFPVPVSKLIITTGCENFPEEYILGNIPVLVLGSSVDAYMREIGVLGIQRVGKRNCKCYSVNQHYQRYNFVSRVLCEFVYPHPECIAITEANQCIGFKRKNYTCIGFDIRSNPLLLEEFVLR